MKYLIRIYTFYPTRIQEDIKILEIGLSDIYLYDSSRKILINLCSGSWQQNRLRQQQAC